MWRPRWKEHIRTKGALLPPNKGWGMLQGRGWGGRCIRKLRAGKRREFQGQTTMTFSVKQLGKLSCQSEEQRDELRCLKESEPGKETGSGQHSSRG